MFNWRTRGWRTRGPDHSASNPLQAPSLAVDSEQGKKIHDRGIFLKAMEWSPAKFHDIGIILHIMEGFPEKCHGMGIILHIMEGFLEKCRGMGIYFAYHGKVSRKVP